MILECQCSSPSYLFASVRNPDWDQEIDDDPVRNNSELVDGNKAQKLTANDIATLKASDATGRSVIEALTEHSATFSTKTEFAKEKYKKKKSRKHVQIACARRPTGAALAAAYYIKSPSRTGYLRSDTLSILLHSANIGAGANTLVLETCGGLVTGAVAERMGGFGYICSTYLGPKSPSLEIIKSFNFSTNIRNSIDIRPLSQLLETVDGEATENLKEEKEYEAIPVDSVPSKLADSLANDTEMVDMVSSGSQALLLESGIWKKQTKPEGLCDSDATENEKSFCQNGLKPQFTNCIVAIASVSPIEAIQALLPLLAPSASFSITYPSLQPLCELLDILRSNGLAVNLSIFDAWLREYQVLPRRTRPMMSMDHGGGYVMKGTITLSGSRLSSIISKKQESL